MTKGECVMQMQEIAVYEDYWCYRAVVNAGYMVKATNTHVQVLFDDGDVYAVFRLRYDETVDEFIVSDRGEVLNGAFDIEPRTHYAAICCALHYFWTRY